MPSLAPSQCHSINELPDPSCTPGVADPRVTQADIQATICVSGYTTTVRPPSSYTDALKAEQIRAYGYSDTNLADYEEDHLIPLEVGGHPTDPRNLWPEPRSGAFPASMKDGLENALHAEVCSGRLTLAAAQQAVATDWETAGALPPPVASPTSAPSTQAVPSAPPAASLCGAPANPWSYNFCSGNLITSPPAGFCSYFHCIASFAGGAGYVVQCADGTFSKSGGRTGVCSKHGGFAKNLYSP